MKQLEKRVKEICDYLNNYFVDEIHEKTFVIENGVLDLSGITILNNQFFKIEDSVLNDGIYQNPCDSLSDETFDGAVITMKIPPDVLDVAEESMEWEKDNSKFLQSPMQSESFGGYSYTKASSSLSASGQVSWRDVFVDRLKAYKKL